VSGNPLLDQFVAEAADLLEQVDAGLLRLEQEPGDAELVNAVFRAAHTFKGSSGLFDLPELTKLTHAAEDLLDAVRGGSLELTPAMVDDLLAAFDTVRNWMEPVAAGLPLPSDAAARRSDLAARLRAPLGDAPAAAAEVASVATTEAPEWLRDLGEDVLRRLAEWLTMTGSALRALRYEPDEGCFFRGEDPLNLVRQLPALEALDIRPAAPWPALAELDEYACVLRFTALTRAGAGEVRWLFRYVEDQLQVAEVDGPALTRLLTGEPAGESDVDPVDDRAATARAVLLAQRGLIAATDQESAESRLASAAVAIRGAAAVLGRAVDPEMTPEALTALVDELLDEVSTVDVPPVPAADAEAGDSPAEATSGGGDRSANRVLKVEQAKVDRLLDLVGELVVAKNSLPFVATEAEEDGHRGLARRIKDEYAVVSRITEELQQAVMDVRMLPVSVAFARMPRLVRDLGRKLGKDVRLVMDGEDAAADKDVIEMLGEPLVHLVRNSLDHGLETPDAREQAGKPREATIELRAAQEGEAVLVEVVDDGRGVDAAAVRAKAYERGLITEAEAEEMPDEEAVQLIFAPGFSTAAQISDVSGRGVGMDAVKNVVESFGGRVGVVSTPGQGCRIQLRLPLTMAVTRVLLVSVDGERFGVPLDNVVETVRVPRERVTFVAGRPVLVIRDGIVPMMDLGGLLETETRDRSADEEVSVLVVRTPSGPAGFVVDRFHQNTDVILKPLEGVLAGTPGYAGTALLGDGLVLLVLDVKELTGRAASTR
jgi:two-component system, chemotaxis family, sensor kinase CheA